MLASIITQHLILVAKVRNLESFDHSLGHSFDNHICFLHSIFSYEEPILTEPSHDIRRPEPQWITSYFLGK